MLASDADRDRVMRSLTDAYVQGRLLHDELGQRIATALRARTNEELEALLDDLRPRPLPAPSGSGTALRTAGMGFPGWLPPVLIGGLLIAVVGSGGQGVEHLWWLVFPAFFVFRGRRGRIGYRGRRY